MVTTLAEIEKLTLQLMQTSIPSEIFEHIQQQCLVALTHFSTQIEGNQLSLEQVSGVIEKRKTFGFVRDEKEAKNYFTLLERMTPLIKKHQRKLDAKLILECHSQLLSRIVTESSRGKFRTVQNAIYETGSKKNVCLPPEAKDVMLLIDELCYWVNVTKAHPIICAAIFHNQFVTVHPFIDGNGRSARFLSLYLLETRNYDWKKIVPIDRYYADNRPLYYDQLQQHYSHNYYFGRHNTDFTKWLEYYVEGIKQMLLGTLNQIALFRTQNILLNNRQNKMLKYLQEVSAISVSEYARRFGISTRMASRDLAQLLELNRVGVMGKARATKYFLKP